MDFLRDLLAIIHANLVDFFNLDWSVVLFKKEYFAVRAALFLIAALLLVIFWRWRSKSKSSYYTHSGYLVDKSYRPGLGYKILTLIPIFFLSAGAIFTLVAMADPYTTQNRQVQLKQSREIGYLRDTSASMGFRYHNTDKCRAELVQDFLLRLIALRKDKKDNSFYATFSYYPYLRADFTTDNESLLFNVATGPMVTADPSAPQSHPEKFILKKFDEIEKEGGTDLALGLEAVIKVFDKKEKDDKKIVGENKKDLSLKKRSVVIVTDGASETDPEEQFKGLQKRGIVPYLVFLDPDREEEIRIHGIDAPQIKIAEALLKEVKQYGGESFLATDEATLDEVLKRLDALHAITAGSKNYIIEQHIYRLPLTFALLLFVTGLSLRFVFWRYHQVV